MYQYMNFTSLGLKSFIDHGYTSGSYLTLSISPLDANDSDMFSKLSLKTSIKTVVIASACIEGTPLLSNLLTYIKHKMQHKQQFQSLGF